MMVHMKPAALVAVLLWLATAPAFAQTTVYQAPTGSVSPSLSITMNLTGGGQAILNPVVGPNCYLGNTCGFPAGYVGTSMSYTLADGSTATLTDFSGTFAPSGSNNYEVSGQASGRDSANRYVMVDKVTATIRITCRSGRGGGCSKVYTGGTLTLTLNATPPATPTATVTPQLATPTPIALPCIGDCNGDGQVTIDELVIGINIALGTATLDQCPAFDCNGNGQVSVDCLLMATNAALNGCEPNGSDASLPTM